MKKILTNNIGMKILAILIAVIGWVVIINYDDPTITKEINDIRVTISNEESISKQNKCYKVESGEEVNILIKGKKSVVDNLSAKDFYAIADLSKSSITNAVPVEVSCILSADIDIVENKNSTMMISLENYITKQFVVTALFKGSVAEGYYISNAEMTISPNRINVSGPESVVSKIDTVKCMVDVTDASSEFSAITDPIALNSNGKRISSESIVYSINNISVKGTPLYMTTVPIKVVTLNDVADGYVVSGKDSSEHEVSIASSDASYIRNIKSVDIPIDVFNLYEKNTSTVNIMDYLQTGTKIVSEERKTDITVDIEKLDEKEIVFKATDVKFSKLPNDIVCNYDNDYTMTVKIRGLSEDIEKIDVDDLMPSVDAGVLTLGNQNAEISFSNISGIEIMSQVSLPVILEEKQIVTPPVTDDNTDKKENQKDDVKEDNNDEGNIADENDIKSEKLEDDSKAVDNKKNDTKSTKH